MVLRRWMRWKLRNVLGVLITLTLLCMYLVKFRQPNSFYANETLLWGTNVWPYITIVDRRFKNGPAESSSKVNARIRYSATSVPFMEAMRHEKSTCTLPSLNVDDPMLKKYFKTPPPLKCAAEQNWAYCLNGTFFIRPEAIKAHGEINCDYTQFYRVTDHATQRRTFPGYKSGKPLKGDYMQVECKAADGKTWRGLSACALPAKDAIKRFKEDNGGQSKGVLGVYILGIDSVSHMTFMRKLAKTYDYLTKHLHGVVLNGYNIVGDGTPQAFIPILTGKTEVELPLTRKRYGKAKYCDVYPMVWKEFAKAGFATFYGEDAAKIGTFTYRLKGFKVQPTDHYFRTFYTVAENEYRKNPPNCFGSEPQHETFWKYMESFFDAYPKEMKKFGVLHHGLLSHDDINLVQVADDFLMGHIERLEQKGHLNNTLLIVMADHGHRFAQFRSTHQGQLEERLPFFSFVAPQWFRKKYSKAWKNLQTNADRLTSPFDIHATLQDLLDFPDEPREMVNASKRSLSLWDEVPADRTCAAAGIEPHWCVCLDWRDVAVSDFTVQLVARAVVQVMNHETAPERALCAELKLGQVVSAKRLAPHSDLLKYKTVKDKDGFVPDLSGNTAVSFALYQLKIKTTPGDGFYEATVSYDGRLRHDVSVNLEDVSAIGVFGDRPHCIIDKNYFLAKWCVCYDRM